MRWGAAKAVLTFAALLALSFPRDSRADPCEDAPAKGLVAFDTIIGPVKVDRAYLGDRFFGVGAPSMTPTFSLWYPDGMPLDLSNRGRNRPGLCDAGEKFIVSFRLEETSEHAKPFGALTTIEHMRENRRVTGADFFQGYGWAEHNLDGPVSGKKDYFVLDDMGDRIAILRCSAQRGDDAPPSPLCHGLIGFLDQGLVVHAQFPSRMGFDQTTPKWREVADFIEVQLALWRIP